MIKIIFSKKMCLKILGVIFMYLITSEKAYTQLQPCKSYTSPTQVPAEFVAQKGNCNLGQSVDVRSNPSLGSNVTHIWAVDGVSTSTDISPCLPISSPGVHEISHAIIISGVPSSFTCQFTIYNFKPDVTYLSGPPSSPINRTLDRQLEIGTIQGGAEVSLSGSATYNIPISIPSGTSNMQPSLGISYNSQANVGLLGMGWNLTTGSNISRVNRDIYHDGFVSSPDLTSTDAFILDGNRLVLEGGTYGTVASTYKTKTESFSNIIATSFNGKLAFTVEDKSGLIREYGMSTDSRITNAAGEAVVWELNKVTDKFGNYFQYKYISINDIRYLDEILYTGNSTLAIAPYNSIKFDYAYRTDKNITYVTGVPLQANLLLTKIIIRAEGAIFSTYDFSYVSDDISSCS
jgi:hypothetical protein